MGVESDNKSPSSFTIYTRSGTTGTAPKMAVTITEDCIVVGDMPMEDMTDPADATDVEDAQDAQDPQEEPDSEDMARGPVWEGILGIEGSPTSDGRFLIRGEIGYRELPIPLKVQTEDEPGHAGSQVCGRIDTIDVIPLSDFDATGWNLSELPGDANVIWGVGTFDTSEAADEAQRLIANGAGVSIDIGSIDRIAFYDPETLQEVPDSELDMVKLLSGGYLQGMAGKIGAATIVAIPAFEEAAIETPAEGVLVASAYGLRVPRNGTLVASGGPLKPPRSWFDDPRLTRLTPLTITQDGRIYGHLADWDGCHTGFGSVCVPPFRSTTDYAYFNVGEMECEDGSLVACGKLMFSRDEGVGHADVSPSLSADDVRRHYDDATRVGGYVRAGTDRFGTWLAGSVRHDLSDEDLQHLRLHPPSGDWRPIPGKMSSELVAAFCVPVPGFPIPRSMVASGSEGLTIISGPVVVEMGDRAQKRRRQMLSERVAELLAE